MDSQRLILVKALLWPIPVEEHAFYILHLRNIYNGYMECKFRNYHYDLNTSTFEWYPKIDDRLSLHGDNEKAKRILECIHDIVINFKPVTTLEAALKCISSYVKGVDLYINTIVSQASSDIWKIWDTESKTMISTDNEIKGTVYRCPNLKLYFNNHRIALLFESLHNSGISVLSLKEPMRTPYLLSKKNVFFFLLKHVMWSYPIESVADAFEDIQGIRFNTPLSPRKTESILDTHSFNMLLEAYEAIEVKIAP